MNKKKMKAVLKDGAITLSILFLFFVSSLIIQQLVQSYMLIPALFLLAVFLISLLTQGYFFGIAASMISMLAVNYAFTYPYFVLNFSITENLVSAVVMLTITIMTSALNTKLRRQEKLKAEAEKEKMRGNLLRAVSHDLRTPLTTIYGSSETMIENYDSLSAEQMLQLAQGIREDAQWLIRMVENLLSVTRITDGNVRLNKSPVVLEELIDSVLIRFHKRYPQQEVQVSLPDDFIIIPMDSVLITQVLVNLLENSVQHAAGMTKLELRVSTMNQDVIFEIRDDGCGIPKDRIEEIFTGYYERKDAPADNQKHNMGIGLTVCASVIKAHGGDIFAENLKPAGCSFRFTLMMEEEKPDEEDSAC